MEPDRAQVAEEDTIWRLIAVVETELNVDVQLVSGASAPSVSPGGQLLPIRDSSGRTQGWMRVIPRCGRAMADDGRLLGVVSKVLDSAAHRPPDRRAGAQRISDILAREDIRIVYQPIFDLVTGAAVGYEALSRFPSPPGRPPDQWFAEAATVGLGVELEVLAVCRALRALSNLPEDVYVSVNVSPAAVSSEQLARVLADAPAQRVVLEITEHDEVDDYEHINEAVARLRRRGARLAVDDTGSGFASMRHVLRLAPDIVKLDATLTHGIDSDSVMRALGYSLKSFAAAIGAEVIAEGIETEREVDALRFLGVALGQGFHLQRPGPLEAAPQLAVSPTSVG